MATSRNPSIALSEQQRQIIAGTFNALREKKQADKLREATVVLSLSRRFARITCPGAPSINGALWLPIVALSAAISVCTAARVVSVAAPVGSGSVAADTGISTRHHRTSRPYCDHAPGRCSTAASDQLWRPRSQVEGHPVAP